MNLRHFARDKPCMVRLPGICNSNCETTVLAHPRVIGISGMGMKAPDELGAWCCSACHDAIDRRHLYANLTKIECEHAHFTGVLRTQNELIKLGVIITCTRIPS